VEDKTLSEHLLDLNASILDKKERGHGEFLTGLGSVDDILFGLDRGQVMVIGGGPGSGKTSLALQMAYNVSESPDTDVLFISLEMTGSELVGRIMCNVMNIDNHYLRTGDVYGDKEALQKKIDLFEKSIEANSMQIIDNRGYKFSELESIIASLYEVKKPDIIFIDFLQLIDWAETNNQNAVIVSFIRKLTELAKTHHIAIVLLSQLRRTPSGSDVKKPTMHDLLGSGAIEQCAHIILILYREFVNDTDKRHHLSIDKNRNGEAGADLLVYFEGRYFRFKDMTEVVETPSKSRWIAPKKSIQERDITSSKIDWEE